MMKIIKISKKKNLYNVVLSDKTSLSFYDDTILKYNLLKPRELKDKELEEIIKFDNEIKAFNMALKYITTKLRTKGEIRKKLKEFDINIIDKVIKRLEKLGYLNDEVYIKSYVNDAINLSLKGPKKIIAELEHLGFRKDQVSLAIDNYDKDLWIQKINKIINKKKCSNHKLSKNMFINKIKNDLINLGYSKDLIDCCLENIDIEEDLNILEKEFNKELKKLSKKYNGNALINKVKYNLYKKGFSLNDIDTLIGNIIA